MLTTDLAIGELKYLTRYPAKGGGGSFWQCCAYLQVLGKKEVVRYDSFSEK